VCIVTKSYNLLSIRGIRFDSGYYYILTLARILADGRSAGCNSVDSQIPIFQARTSSPPSNFRLFRVFAPIPAGWLRFFPPRRDRAAQS